MSVVKVVGINLSNYFAHSRNTSCIGLSCLPWQANGVKIRKIIGLSWEIHILKSTPMWLR